MDFQGVNEQQQIQYGGPQVKIIPTNPSIQKHFKSPFFFKWGSGIFVLLSEISYLVFFFNCCDL